MNMLLSALVLLLLSYVAYRLIRLAWYKLHKIAGIEVGMSQYALPTSAVLKPPAMRLAYQANTLIPNTFGSDSRFELLPRAVNTKAKANSPKAKSLNAKLNRSPLSQSILGIDMAVIERMPTPAVILLDEINDKLIRYHDWQRHQTMQAQTGQTHQQTQWLTENKFVVNRLIEQPIPEAVSHYDQRAKYHPSHLNEKIYGELTAGEMLTDVLARVSHQLDELLSEMFREVSEQFASTYRYVKNRT